MHPIERLRYVARAKGAPAEVLVEESAYALRAFGDDPAGLVAACRRIVDRQLTCAPLWWLCARMLCAPEPMAEARAALDDLGADPTARHLAGALPDAGSVVVVGTPDQSLGALRRRGDLRLVLVDVDGGAADAAHRLTTDGADVDLVDPQATGPALDGADLLLVDALAIGPTHALVPAGAAPAAALARATGVDVWLVAGVGRLMPARMFDALVSRWSGTVDPLAAAEELVPLAWCSRVAGVDGPLEPSAALAATDCPVAPELFRLVG